MPQHLCVIIKNYVKQFDWEKVQFSWRKISKERTCNFWKHDPVYQMSLITLSNLKCFLLYLWLVQLHGAQQKPAFLHRVPHSHLLVSLLQVSSQITEIEKTSSHFPAGPSWMEHCIQLKTMAKNEAKDYWEFLRNKLQHTTQDWLSIIKKNQHL